MNCVSCKKKKENLLLPNPEVIDKEILMGYVAKRDNGGLTPTSIYEYFVALYSDPRPYNPKSVRRAMINMDSLYLQYTRGQLSFDTVVVPEAPKAKPKTTKRKTKK